MKPEIANLITQMRYARIKKRKEPKKTGFDQSLEKLGITEFPVKEKPTPCKV